MSNTIHTVFSLEGKVHRRKTQEGKHRKKRAFDGICKCLDCDEVTSSIDVHRDMVVTAQPQSVQKDKT